MASYWKASAYWFETVRWVGIVYTGSSYCSCKIMLPLSYHWSTHFSTEGRNLISYFLWHYLVPNYLVYELSKLALPSFLPPSLPSFLCHPWNISLMIILLAIPVRFQILLALCHRLHVWSLSLLTLGSFLQLSVSKYNFSF
jgi:hypothetical protein